MAYDSNTWKLKGEEQKGDREQKLREEVLKSKTLNELKRVLSNYQDIIHRDTDFRVQNILEHLQSLQMKDLHISEMPEQYGIKSKLVELLAFDKSHYRF